MATTLIGYARCSTDKQDLAAQKAALETLGVAVDRIYTDYGLTGTNRSRPGLDQALAAVRTGDTLVVPKLDRLARSVPDARFIADALIARGVRLALGSSVYDPVDPMGKMFFNILATFAESEADLIRLRTREGHGGRACQGQAARQAAQALRPSAEGAAPDARHRRVLHQRPGRAVHGVPPNSLPDPWAATACPIALAEPRRSLLGIINCASSYSVPHNGIFAREPHVHHLSAEPSR